MPQINVLSAHVADLIAAGEVVERPASAVKELLENAVDAQARTVVVELRSGGRELIRVTDDGVGMAPEDAGVCFLRHATSKLRDERGLEAIGTLGFRGEALAAIASVSHITMTTRPRGARQGTRMELTAGEIDVMEECGCPEGTTLWVRDLFYNTPARQKFLGSDRSEAAACVQAALRCALGHPEVSFRCLRDGQEEFFTPGDGQPLSAIYALLGRDIAAGMLSVDTQNQDVRVHGFVTAPGYCRGNRSGQYFFCNARPIRSKTLQAALEQAYKNTAMIGKFPGCVLYIELPNGLVDVNVHPTKAEVKFAREKPVFDGVYYGALAALGQEGRPPVPVSEPKPANTGAAAPRADFFRSMNAAEFKKSFAAPERPRQPLSLPRQSVGAFRPRPVSPPESAPMESPAESREAPVLVRDDAPYTAERSYEVHRQEPEAEQLVLHESFAEKPWRLIGEALGVYILVERGDELLLIDKHAAHERLLFDRMRLDDKPLMSQELMDSRVVTLGGEGAELAEENAALLSRLGFALERFGEDSVAIRAVPADLDADASAPLLEELIEKLRTGRSLSAADVWERLAATVACKAAVKANTFVGEEGMRSLAEKVLRGEVTHCPHGRPVMCAFSRTELDKRFGRIQ